MGFATLEDLRGAVGTEVGVSPWITIEQAQVDEFASATGDHQWIHTDPERAAAGPFGTTIAHGFLTLSLLPVIGDSVLHVDGIRMGVNYGTNKVRFPAPVPVGSRVRGRVELVEVTDVPGGVQIVTKVTIEREGGGKPACVAESVSRLFV
ncbi:acyl dehydratase [Streptacidiphilus sp. MAP12-20]|uniref:MaoC family dehydratase n=1 Tax=Streptacidiphilus sp. MAP12-20 TaxID=3156299 RepID=UPI0035173ECB